MRVVLLLCLKTALLLGQQPAPAAGRRAANPLAGKPEAIAAGEKLYGTSCGPCHGKGAKGGEAPSLHHSRLVVFSPDRRFFEVIRKGIPGSEMPPYPGPDETIWQIVAYVHSISKPGQGPPVPGDAEAGRVVFKKAGCEGCHIVNGSGGALGPDLSSIALQSSSEQIRESVLNPDGNIAEGFQTVRLVTDKGQKIQGVLKNEDNFSIQIISSEGALMAFTRSELVSVEVDHKRSLMPARIGRSLSAEDLQNLLAFLDRQRKPFIRSQVSFQNY